jgi:hypothetical protein
MGFTVYKSMACLVIIKLRVWNLIFSNAYKFIVTAHYFDFISVNTQNKVLQRYFSILKQSVYVWPFYCFRMEVDLEDFPLYTWKHS